MSATVTQAGQGTWQRNVMALSLLSLVNILSMADRVLLGIVTEPVKQELALSDTQMSLANGFLFVFFNLVAGLFIARWVDRSNRKRILALGLAVWTLATAMTGWAQDFAMLSLSRTLVGAGEATVFPVAISMIADLYPAPTRPRPIGIFQSGAFVGLVGGSILAGVLASVHGWRTMFTIFGIAGVVLLGLICAFLVEPERVDRAQPANISSNTATFWSALLAVLNVPGFALLGLGLGISNMGVAVLAAWAPAFFQRSHGIDIAQVGAVVGPAVGIGAISGALLSGMFASWLVRRSGKNSAGLLLPIITLPLAAPCFVGLVMSPQLGSALLSAGLMNFLLCAAVTPCMALSVALVQPDQRGLAATLLLFCTGLIGGGLAPFLVGLLSDTFMPQLGNEALRYAIVSMAPAPIIAAFSLWLARGRMASSLDG